jgi:hypothetical protein
MGSLNPRTSSRLRVQGRAFGRRAAMGDAKEAPGAGGQGFAHHPLATGAPAPCAPPALSHTPSSRALAAPILCSPSPLPPRATHVQARARSRRGDTATLRRLRPRCRRALGGARRVVWELGAGIWCAREAGCVMHVAHREAGEGTRTLRPPRARPRSCSMHARTHACMHARTHAHTLNFSDLLRAVGSSGRPRRRRRRHGAGGRGCGVRGGAAAESLLDEVMDSVPADQGRGTNSQKYSIK